MPESRRRRRGKKGRKKVRWKRMYVGHVAAGIASMCHRGNHAGNAEAHLTALPSCIQLPPSYSVYIYCLRASTNCVSFTALSFSLAITFHTLLRFSQHAFSRKYREIRGAHIISHTDFINAIRLKDINRIIVDSFLIRFLFQWIYIEYKSTHLSSCIYLCGVVSVSN